MSLSKENKILSLILLIFYIVGIVGISMDSYREDFLKLSSLNLLLTLGIFIFGNKDFSRSFFFLFLIIASLGFLIEVAGVKTGIIFGEYEYGEPLGVKWMEVPMVIGINWFLVLIGAFSLVSVFIKNKLGVILAGALLMTILDFIIEPVAVKLGFWYWKYGVIPMQNYFAWWFFSAILMSIIVFYKRSLNKSLGIFILILQFLFFGLLNLMLL